MTIFGSGRGSIARARGTPATSPGALPAFNSGGTIASSGTIPNTLTPTHGATITAGDLLICVGHCRNSAGDATVAMHADMAAAGWANVTAPIASGNTAMGAFWKIAAGTEDGTNVPGGLVLGGTNTSPCAAAVVFRFTAADGFAADPFESETISAVNAPAGTAAMPTVTPSGTNRLAVTIFAMHNDGLTMASATGESGGDWTEAYDQEITTGSDMTFHVQTSDQSSGAAISGGTAAVAVATSGNRVGFALVPASV